MLNNHKYIAFETILIKEIRRFTRIWVQTLVPPAITIGLYFLIFGNLIGSRIGSMSGYSYMDFIVPGLIMMAVIQNAYANVVSSFFSQKFQRSIEELLVSPVPNYIILAGFVAGGVARSFCRSDCGADVFRFHGSEHSSLGVYALRSIDDCSGLLTCRILECPVCQQLR